MQIGRNRQRAVCRLFNPLPPPVKRVLGHQRSSRMPLKNGCRTLPSADFARYSISASKDGSTQIPRCDPLGIGLRFSDQRFETRLEILRGNAVETMVDFSGIGQSLAASAAPARPVAIVFLHGEAADCQRLPLRAGLLDPIVAPA